MYARFVFSSIQPYPPFANAVFLITVCMEKCPSPSSGTFLMTATVTSFPSPRLVGRCCHSCLLWLASLFTVHLRDCPSPTLQSLGCPTLFAMCLFFFLAACLLFSLVFFLFFFPWVGVSLSRGLCWSGPGFSVGVPHAA
jgi:hypothetical protein